MATMIVALIVITLFISYKFMTHIQDQQLPKANTLLKASEKIIELKEREWQNAGTRNCVRFQEWEEAYRQLKEAIDQYKSLTE
jgi:hypothetical protein